MNQTEIVACIYKHVGRTKDLEKYAKLAEEIAIMAAKEGREARANICDKLAAALLAAVAQKHYNPISDPTGVDGAQMWNGQWWMPLWGCDTLDSMLDDMAYAVARLTEA